MRPFRKSLIAIICLAVVGVSSQSEASVITANIEFNKVIFEGTIYRGPYAEKVDIVDTVIGAKISAKFQIFDTNNNFQLDYGETLIFDYSDPMGMINSASYIKDGDVLIGGGPNIYNFQILPMPTDVNSRQQFYFTAFVDLALMTELDISGPTSAGAFVWDGDNGFFYGYNSYQWLEYDGSPPPPVPLPAAAWFFLTGLAGLAGLKLLNPRRQGRTAT